MPTTRHWRILRFDFEDAGIRRRTLKGSVALNGLIFRLSNLKRSFWKFSLDDFREHYLLVPV